MSPIATSVPVTITNGIPSQDPANMDNIGQLQFTNADSQGYLLEFWSKGNDKHAAVSIVIAAGGTITVQGNSASNDQDTTCNYNVLTLTGGETDPADGGTHSIIIGSVGDDKN
jgi:hypothetical protein